MINMTLITLYLGGIFGTAFAMWAHGHSGRVAYSLIFPYVYYRMYYRKDWQ